MGIILEDLGFPGLGLVQVMNFASFSVSSLNRNDRTTPYSGSDGSGTVGKGTIEALIVIIVVILAVIIVGTLLVTLFVVLVTTLLVSIVVVLLVILFVTPLVILESRRGNPSLNHSPCDGRCHSGVNLDAALVVILVHVGTSSVALCVILVVIILVVHIVFVTLLVIRVAILIVILVVALLVILGVVLVITLFVICVAIHIVIINVTLIVSVTWSRLDSSKELQEESIRVSARIIRAQTFLFDEHVPLSAVQSALALICLDLLAQWDDFIIKFRRKRKRGNFSEGGNVIKLRTLGVSDNLTVRQREALGGNDPVSVIGDKVQGDGIFADLSE